MQRCVPWWWAVIASRVADKVAIRSVEMSLTGTRSEPYRHVISVGSHLRTYTFEQAFPQAVASAQARPARSPFSFTRTSRFDSLGQFDVVCIRRFKSRLPTCVPRVNQDAVSQP